MSIRWEKQPTENMYRTQRLVLETGAMSRKDIQSAMDVPQGRGSSRFASVLRATVNRGLIAKDGEIYRPAE
jgi:hypothetical protein